MIGIFCNCEDCGPIGNLCRECRGAQYVDGVTVGTCHKCGGKGIKHTLCTGCEDQSLLYEYNISFMIIVNIFPII